MKHKFLLALSFCAMSGLSVYAQKVTMHFQKVKLEKVFGEITRQTGLTVAYSQPTVNPQRIVSVNANKEDVGAVLSRLLAGTNVTYEIGKEKIYLKLAKTQSNGRGGQKKKLKGKIVDANGEPIIGASVKVEGMPVGTVTDIDGNYSLENVPDGAKLDISYMGYKNMKVSLDRAEKHPSITMQEDDKLLDEVVVVGYGTQTKKTLTGAVSTMDMNSVETSTVTSISHALAGKAAGLRVNLQSAQPGGGAKFRIRGEASTGAGNDPLFVIDGFPVSSKGSLGSGNIYDAGTTDNVLESLNPEDIESISVLKDAASTAIYGARAGHGVVLITTKRGQSGKPTVSYTASGSLQNIRANYDMLDAAQFMDMYNKQTYEKYLMQYGLGIYEGYVQSSEKPTSFTPAYSNDQIKYMQGTDWLKEVTWLGYMQQHNLSVNGGTDAMRYMASVNYMSQNGIVKNNGTTRFSMRFNFDYKFSKYISAGITSSYSQNRYDNVPLGDGENENSGILTAAVRANPALPIYDEDGNYTIDPRRATVPNPVSLLDITDKTKKDHFMGSAFISVKPFADLEMKLNLGADRRFQKRSNYLPKTTLEGQRNLGAAFISQEDSQDYLMELTATYSKKIKNHDIKLLGGYSFQKFTYDGVSAGNSEFLIDGFTYNNLGSGAAAKPSVGSWAAKSSMGSYFARLNYMYANRYLFEATMRADGASNFAPGNRWGYFPSVALGWVMSEEKFMEKTRSWLSNLKWRFSYGQTGNSNVGNHVTDAYSVGYNSVIGGVEKKGVYASKLGNPSLTWETTSELNVGVDLGLFRDRIRLTAEYFNRRISDLLMSNKKLLSYHEVNVIAANAGATKSQGVEFTLNTVNIKNKNFDWNTTLTLSHYEDRWAERPADWKPNPYQKVNDPIRAWWSYESEGLLQVGEKAPAAQADLLPGQVKIKDQNEDGVINDYDLVYMDNGDPKLIFGLNNSLRYKNFDLSIYFYGEIGRKRGASYLEDWTQAAQGANVSTYVYKAFSSQNTAATKPSFLYSAYGYGDFYVRNVSYLRCGNITLGYTLPVKNRIIKSCRVYADVNNPFVITNWTGLDPETDNGSYPYPNVTSYSIGFNIKF